MLIFPLILLSSITLVTPAGLPSGLVNLLQMSPSKAQEYISSLPTVEPTRNNCSPSKVMTKIERFSSLIEQQVNLLLDTLDIENDVNETYNISSCSIMENMVSVKYQLKNTWLRLNKIILSDDISNSNRNDDIPSHSDNSQVLS